MPDGERSEADAQRGAELQRAYGEALALLGELVAGPPPVEEILDELLAVALTAAPGLAAASVTALSVDGELVTAATTDAAAQTVDELEYRLHEGPCVVALDTGVEQLVSDVRTDDRWPNFSQRALELGFSSVAGLPLVNAGETIGALNVFGAAPGDLDEQTLAPLRRLMGPLAAALARGRAHRRYQRLLDQRSAREDRSTADR
ncbi:GAF domain-containing protein [Egicoccus sp. AB-alg6-2]|uniref:GAF domain-containing protein n=1 Tax=Egicoccus sp. AB-alg6-2 TaxID=3242692 RepID=UPI00359E4D7C